MGTMRVWPVPVHPGPVRRQEHVLWVGRIRDDLDLGHRLVPALQDDGPESGLQRILGGAVHGVMMMCLTQDRVLYAGDADGLAHVG